MSRSRGTGNVTEVTGEDNHVDWSDPEIWTMIDDNQIGGRDGGAESCDAECEILTGIAERAIAIYFEMVRCMLHTASMDLRYWGEAFLYAVHIRNITYTSALKDRVPDHAWYDRKPDVSHLRVFGSIAYVNIPKKLLLQHSHSYIQFLFFSLFPFLLIKYL